MKKYIAFAVIGILAILGALGFLRFAVGGEEDAWLCVSGEWVRHGNPSQPMPATECYGDVK